MLKFKIYDTCVQKNKTNQNFEIFLVIFPVIVKILLLFYFNIVIII